MNCKKRKTLFMGMVVLLVAMPIMLAPAPMVKAQATTTLTVTATLQGAARPAAGYNVPLTLKLYTGPVTSMNILTLVPLFTFTTAAGNISITDINTITHVITFTVSGVPVGIFNITLYTPHCLVNLKSSVMIAETGAMANMGTLREGDARDITEGSKIIDITDFSTLAFAYASVPGNANWDARADFDRNGQVNALDLSLLAFNYLKTSPQVVP